MRFSWILFLSALPAYPQLFSAGVKAGVPLTDFEDAAQSAHVDYFTHTNRYIVGVTGELHLPFGLGVEVDVLYRHLNYQSTMMGVDTFASAHTTANAWEFPILAKYRFHTKVVRPFVDTGIAFDTLQGLKQTASNFTVVGIFNSSTSQPSELSQNTTRGLVLGGGLDLNVFKLVHVQPEIRYTRWGGQHFVDVITGLLHSNQNQAEFLLGIVF
jgi:opacity protein-like surface antigen